MVLRRGKWRPEEQSYAEALIRYFLVGVVPDCTDGTTLRAYLAAKLKCAPMRITKKFAGATIGKSIFCRTGRLANADLTKLEALEIAFWRADVEPFPRDADTSWATRVVTDAADIVKKRRRQHRDDALSDDLSDDPHPPPPPLDSHKRPPPPPQDSHKRPLTSSSSSSPPRKKSRPISIHTTVQGQTLLRLGHLDAGVRSAVALATDWMRRTNSASPPSSDV